MATQSFDHTTRQLNRAKEIAHAALQAPEQKQVGLKVLAPDMLATADAYLLADQHTAALERDLAKEAKESDRAVKRLESLYDEFLPVARHKADFEAPAASQYPTSDDFLAGAEELEAAFEQYQGEAWADTPLASLSDLSDQTAKEYADQIAVQRQLQKAEKRRASAAVEARTQLIPFRQVVRATFGRTSQEYRDLKDRRYRPARKSPPAQ